MANCTSSTPARKTPPTQPLTPAPEESVLAEIVVVASGTPEDVTIPITRDQQPLGGSCDQNQIKENDQKCMSSSPIDIPTSLQSDNECTTHFVSRSNTISGATSVDDAPNGQYSVESCPSEVETTSQVQQVQQVQTTSLNTASAVTSQKPVGNLFRTIKLCEACKNLKESERKLETCNDCTRVVAGEKTVSQISADKQAISKTLVSKKTAGIWCKFCEERKAETGEDGRTRKNAKHRCPDCAKLRAEATAALEEKASSAAESKGEIAGKLRKNDITRSEAVPKLKRKTGKSHLHGPQSGPNKKKLVGRKQVEAIACQEGTKEYDNFDHGADEDEPESRPPPTSTSGNAGDFFVKPEPGIEPLSSIIKANCARESHPAPLGTPFDFFDHRGKGVRFDTASYPKTFPPLAPQVGFEALGRQFAGQVQNGPRPPSPTPSENTASQLMDDMDSYREYEILYNARMEGV